ncbi:unnamed protein product [Peronospora belbahrii]|uniref:Uncharacterized protein n=1 Tax=Peronospora belbahrii TaxID=622444 RepID=A0ABN8D1I5_9STRA|nr:unnamed protein product [Peronospora belbahrii]
MNSEYTASAGWSSGSDGETGGRIRQLQQHVPMTMPSIKFTKRVDQTCDENVLLSDAGQVETSRNRAVNGSITKEERTDCRCVLRLHKRFQPVKPRQLWSYPFGSRITVMLISYKMLIHPPSSTRGFIQ